MCHLKALEKKGLIHREPNMSRAIMLATETPEGSGGLPLAGRIAAGHLQEAVSQDDGASISARCSAPMTNTCSRWRGDSMIEDQIADGDYVVIRKQDTAQRGQIVVALTDENEATLGCRFPEANRIRLEPANSSMEPIYVKNARVLGVVVGVVRKVGEP